MSKNAQYQRDFKQRMREEGRERLEEWPKAHHKPAIKRVASGLENELFDTEELERWLRVVEGVSDE